MAQALVIAKLGSHVKPTGVGRDKGRDLQFRGPVDYAGRSGAWNGRGVVQIKHRPRDVDTGQNTRWVKKHIADELGAWQPGPRGAAPRRDDRPDYYLFITGATLSPEGQDACLAELEKQCLALGIKDWDLWSRAEVSRLLDSEVGIRRTYLHFIVPGDILAALESSYSEDNRVLDLGKQLSVGAAVELSARQWARLGDSGIESEERLRLASVAVDLPCEPKIQLEEKPIAGFALKLMISRGEGSLRKSNEPKSRGLLLIGGPGQGKSTIVQLLCQLHRAAFLQDNSALLTAQLELLKQVGEGAKRLGLDLPRTRRWPVYVDLSSFGDAVAGDPSASLMRYIASQVRVQGERLNPNELLRWRRTWPWLVVLDGLDEVANPAIREHVTSAVNEFLTDCSINDDDVFVVATTRPQGYHGEFSEFELEEFELLQLDPERALEYGRLLAETRHYDDLLAKEKVIKRLTAASKDATIRRLMSTPLQVTIMSTLLEQMNRVPATRHALFDAYYKAIYSREEVKASTLGDALKNYQPIVDYLHEQVALYLHVQAQEPGRAESTVPSEALTPLLLERLRADEHPEEVVRRVAETLVQAVRNRVVLLVGIKAEEVGYEVRSLQEYFASRALTAGAEETILERMSKLVPSSHWRNTLLLAAGRLEKHPNSGLVRALLPRLEEADTAGQLSIEVRPGQRLALDLLDDSFAARVPAVRRVLLQRALGMIERWGDRRIRDLARVAAVEIETSEESYSLVKNACERGLGVTGSNQSSTVALLTSWQKLPKKPGTLANYLLEKAHGWRSVPNAQLERASIGGYLRGELDQSEISSEQQAKLDELWVHLDHATYSAGTSAAESGIFAKNSDRAPLPILLAVLANPELQRRFIELLARIPVEHAQVAIFLREHLLWISDGEPVDTSGLISDNVVQLLSFRSLS